MIYITGTTVGLGLMLSTRLKTEPCSRANGIDLATAAGRNTVTNLLLNPEISVLINCTCVRTNLAAKVQLNLLHDVMLAWNEIKKPGLIINVGSIKAMLPRFSSLDDEYTLYKRELRYASLAYSTLFSEKKSLIRCSLLSTGPMDSELNRSRNSGIPAEDITSMVETVIRMSPTTQIPEVIIEGLGW